MRPRSLILFGLALGCGTIAAIGINQVLANRSQQTVVNGPTESIYVALTDVDMGAQLNTQNVKVEQWPRDKVPAGAITKLEDLDGLRVRTRVFAGEPILAAKLLSRNANGSSASEMIPSGYRVVAVKVDDVSSTSSLIKPGDRVDVLVHLRASPNTGVHETATRTLLQNISVFAVNEIFQRPNEIDAGTIAARTVSLLVTPEQAELVTLATELGTIRLVLRSIEDEDVAATRGATTQHVTGHGTSGSRAAEEAVGLGGGDEDNPLLEMLNEQQRAPATKVAAVPADPTITDADRWRMLVLEGAKMTHVHISPDGTQTSQVVGEVGANNHPLPLTPAQPKAAADESADEATSDDVTTGEETPIAEDPADGTPATDEEPAAEATPEDDGQSDSAPGDEPASSEPDSVPAEPQPTAA
jgi:pilus assembly protein CpaB